MRRAATRRALLARRSLHFAREGALLKELVVRQDAELLSALAEICRRDQEKKEKQQQQQQQDGEEERVDEEVRRVCERRVRAFALQLWEEAFADCTADHAHAVFSAENEAAGVDGPYGEVHFASFAEVLRVALQDFGGGEDDGGSGSGHDRTNTAPQSPHGSRRRRQALKFIDLGSGSGRAVLCAALLTDMVSFTGVEMVGGLVREACQVRRRFMDTVAPLLGPQFAAQQEAAVQFHTGSFLDDRFDWSDCDIVFANSTCFDSELMAGIAQKAENLREGTRLITFTVALPSMRFAIIWKERMKMAWGPATVYVHEKLSDDKYEARLAGDFTTEFDMDQQPSGIDILSVPDLSPDVMEALARARGVTAAALAAVEAAEPLRLPGPAAAAGQESEQDEEKNATDGIDTVTIENGSNSSRGIAHSPNPDGGSSGACGSAPGSLPMSARDGAPSVSGSSEADLDSVLAHLGSEYSEVESRADTSSNLEEPLQISSTHSSPYLGALGSIQQQHRQHMRQFPRQHMTSELLARRIADNQQRHRQRIEEEQEITEPPPRRRRRRRERREGGLASTHGDSVERGPEDDLDDDDEEDEDAEGRAALSRRTGSDAGAPSGARENDEVDSDEDTDTGTDPLHVAARIRYGERIRSGSGRLEGGAPTSDRGGGTTTANAGVGGRARPRDRGAFVDIAETGVVPVHRDGVLSPAVRASTAQEADTDAAAAALAAAQGGEAGAVGASATGTRNGQEGVMAPNELDGEEDEFVGAEVASTLSAGSIRSAATASTTGLNTTMSTGSVTPGYLMRASSVISTTSSISMRVHVGDYEEDLAADNEDDEDAFQREAAARGAGRPDRSARRDGADRSRRRDGRHPRRRSRRHRHRRSQPRQSQAASQSQRDGRVDSGTDVQGHRPRTHDPFRDSDRGTGSRGRVDQNDSLPVDELDDDERTRHQQPRMRDLSRFLERAADTSSGGAAASNTSVESSNVSVASSNLSSATDADLATMASGADRSFDSSVLSAARRAPFSDSHDRPGGAVADDVLSAAPSATSDLSPNTTTSAMHSDRLFLADMPRHSLDDDADDDGDDEEEDDQDDEEDDDDDDDDDDADDDNDDEDDAEHNDDIDDETGGIVNVDNDDEEDNGRERAGSSQMGGAGPDDGGAGEDDDDAHGSIGSVGYATGLSIPPGRRGIHFGGGSLSDVRSEEGNSSLSSSPDRLDRYSLDDTLRDYSRPSSVATRVETATIHEMRDSSRTVGLARPMQPEHQHQPHHHLDDRHHDHDRQDARGHGEQERSGYHRATVSVASSSSGSILTQRDSSSSHDSGVGVLDMDEDGADPEALAESVHDDRSARAPHTRQLLPLRGVPISGSSAAAAAGRHVRGGTHSNSGISGATHRHGGASDSDSDDEGAANMRELRETRGKVAAAAASSAPAGVAEDGDEGDAEDEGDDGVAPSDITSTYSATADTMYSEVFTTGSVFSDLGSVTDHPDPRPASSNDSLALDGVDDVETPHERSRGPLPHRAGEGSSNASSAESSVHDVLAEDNRNGSGGEDEHVSPVQSIETTLDARGPPPGSDALGTASLSTEFSLLRGRAAARGGRTAVTASAQHGISPHGSDDSVVIVSREISPAARAAALPRRQQQQQLRSPEHRQSPIGSGSEGSFVLVESTSLGTVPASEAGGSA